MRHAPPLLILAVGLGILASAGTAQQPKDRPTSPAKAAPKDRPANVSAVDAFVARMMAFDKNKDGKLTRDEITDRRLLRLFDRADANKDGVVTREELVALATQLLADEAANGGGRRGGFGPRGGRGGPFGFGGPPQPGQIMPLPLRNMLQLTDAQKKQLADLQKEVDGKLEKLLTAKQRKQLEDLRRRGPSRGGPRGPREGERGLERPR